MSRAVRRGSKNNYEVQAPWSDEELNRRLRAMRFLNAPYQNLVVCPNCGQGISYRYLSGWDNLAIELTDHSDPGNWARCEDSLGTFCIEAWQVRLI